jgi:hypothetical protein
MSENEEQKRKRLIGEAKDVGVKSPHLFRNLETLESKIAEAKNSGGGSDEDDASAGSDGDSGDGLSQDDGLVKDGDGWLYHETEQPRIFKDGEEIPEGWNLDNRANWVFPDYGKPINVNS